MKINYHAFKIFYEKKGLDNIKTLVNINHKFK